jgi:hypothetical protein
MRFLFLICADDSFDPPDTIGAETDLWVDDVDGRGIRLIGDRIQPEDQAITVRTQNDDLVTRPGPHVQTAEQVVGFDVIDARDMAEAIEIASRHPMARYGGAIEIRGFWQG